MAELKKEEAKKELEGLVGKAESDIQKNKEASMSPEEKKAFEAKRDEDAKKAEEARIQAEAQAKKDAALLLMKDEDIKDEADRKRKAELLEKQKKEEEDKLSAEDKIRRVEEKSQKRIDELVNQLKEIKDKSSKEAESLRREIETLRKEKAEPTREELTSLVEKEEAGKIKKYLDEDKSLPREKRREMDDGELDEWLLEDQKSAIAWIQRRELRREIDKRQNLIDKQREGASKKLFEQQAKSYAQVIVKHPELDVKKRKEELKAEGKSDDEIESIVRSENKKYDTIIKIAEENPDWKFNPKAPELAMEEMEKRLKEAPEPGEKGELEKLREELEELKAELARRDSTDEGIPPGVPPRRPKEGEYTETEQVLIDTMKSAKATQAMIDSALKDYRKKHPR